MAERVIGLVRFREVDPKDVGDDAAHIVPVQFLLHRPREQDARRGDPRVARVLEGTGTVVVHDQGATPPNLGGTARAAVGGHTRGRLQPRLASTRPRGRHQSDARDAASR